MDYLETANERRTKTKSSISQARDTKFSTTNNLGQFFPVVSDHLDYIDCNKVKSHLVSMSLTPESDYEYPVGECAYYTDKYIYVDHQTTELRTLPHWAGDGFYKAYVDDYVLTNFDSEALGTRNKQTLQVGLHYVEAVDNLD